MPTIQIRLAPPSKPMPEVNAVVSQLDAERSHFEKESLEKLEETFSKSLEKGRAQIHAMVDRVMKPFKSLVTIKADGRRQHQKGYSALSFLEKLGGEEMSAKINLLPMAPPAVELEAKLNDIESVRLVHDTKVFQQAAAEMEGLTSIVVNEAEAQLTAYINRVLRLLGHRLIQQPHKDLAASTNMTGTSFAETAKQPVLSTGLQLATNLRVMASEAAFPKVEDLVEDMERRRGASENLARKRILEMDLRLLQAENAILGDSVRANVETLLASSVSAA